MAEISPESDSKIRSMERAVCSDVIISRATSAHSSEHRGEAIELDDLHSHYSLKEYHITPLRTISKTSRRSSVQSGKGPFRSIRAFWLRNVTLTVPEKNNRDYLGEYHRSLLLLDL
jgi:hypothetical protein